MIKILTLSLFFYSPTFANSYLIDEVSLSIKEKTVTLDPLPKEYLSIIHVIEKAASKAAKNKQWEDAVILANKAIELAKKNKFENIENPHMNCSLHTSHIILGANALNQGQLKEAEGFLLASLNEKSLAWYQHQVKTKEKLKEGQPCVGFDFWTPDSKLALMLLNKGRKDAVVNYLNMYLKRTLIRGHWVKDSDVRKWLKIIKEGHIPHKDLNGPIESYLDKQVSMDTYSKF